MVQGLVRSWASKTCFSAALRTLPATVKAPMATAGARRVLSAQGASGLTSPGPPPPPPPPPAQDPLRQGAKAEDKRPIWPYLKAAKQQFFNVVLASLAITMAVKMVEGKGTRVALEEQIDELERREGVLLSALTDEEWAEGVLKKLGITGGKGGKEALLRELNEVVRTSMLDKESARLETMRSAAVNASGDSSRQASKSDSRGSGNAPPKSATPASKGML